MTDIITTDSAKSMLRVFLAKAVADTVVCMEAVMREAETPLTEIQKVELISVAMMGYRSVVEQAESSVEMEVLMEEMRAAHRASKVAREPEWASEEELFKLRSSVWYDGRA